MSSDAIGVLRVWDVRMARERLAVSVRTLFFLLLDCHLPLLLYYCLLQLSLLFVSAFGYAELLWFLVQYIRLFFSAPMTSP